jgi:hypothetical protein
MRTVYLCGGINGLSDSDATDWRKAATDQLSSRYRILDPMRRDYRGREATNVKEIVDGDLDDIRASDILLVNAVRPSWGTGMELFYAASIPPVPPILKIKLVVTVCPVDSPSPWLVYFSDVVFKTFQEGIAYLLHLEQ